MSKHAGLIKGLAAGAVLGAVAHLVLSMEHKDEKKAAWTPPSLSFVGSKIYPKKNYPSYDQN